VPPSPLSTAAILDAFEANLWLPFSAASHLPWMQLADDGDLRWAMTGIPMGAFNAVLAARLTGDEEAVERRLDALDARFADGTPMSWWLLPTSRPVDLARRLERRGFQLSGPLPVMGLALAEWQAPAWPDGMDVEVVRTAAAYVEACAVVSDGYPVPWDGLREMADRYGELVALGRDMRCFVARAAGSGRALASAMAMRDGSVVGLWNVATLPEARRRGAATAVTLAALDDARSTGATLAVLASTAEALSLYRRLGFEAVGDLTIAGRGG
jgi:ribosomal protein S18 acetylase RimI-like enzyme